MRLGLRLLVFALPACLACDGPSGAGDAGDAAADVIDAGSDAYQPIGVRCDQPTAAPAPPWTPDDAGAPLHPPIVVSSGGPALKNPALVAITFDGDAYRDPLEDFVASVGCTSYWRAIGADYGIGDAYAGGVAHFASAPASVTGPDVANFIRAEVAKKTIPYPAPDETIFVIFYPATTDVVLPSGAHSCTGFHAFHYETTLIDGHLAPYALVPRCSDDFTKLTAGASHEIVEAATDPFPGSKPAYLAPEPNGLAWGLAFGGEVADMCELNDDAAFVPSDYPFTVQRSWSSAAPFHGHDPCVPSVITYFAAAPVLTDTIAYGQATTTGVALALNASTSIDLKLVADGAWTTPIGVAVEDAEHDFGAQPALTFSLSAAQGNAGDTLTLGITRTGTNASLGVEPFLIHATSQGVTRSWWALVGDP